MGEFNGGLRITPGIPPQAARKPELRAAYAPGRGAVAQHSGIANQPAEPEASPWKAGP